MRKLKKSMKLENISELKINIILNFIIKGGSILINFLMIPLMLKYLDSKEYGLWLLILSIINWIYTFDIGIGNSLRNKIAEYRVKENDIKIKEVIITSYVYLLILSLIFFIIICIVLKFININLFLNVMFIEREKLYKLIILNIGFVCINFVLSLCNNIFIGSQKTYLSALNNFFNQILILGNLYILILLKKKSIFYLSIIYGSSISFSHIILTSYYFIKNRRYIPTIGNFCLSKISELLNIGGKIFLIQIASLIIFSTDNFIISYFLGTEKVAEYNIVNKYCTIPMIILNLISTPLWSQATKKYYEKDYEWFMEIIKKIKKFFILVCFMLLVQIVIGKYFINIWTNGRIEPQITLILITTLSVALTCYSNMYSTILFGINEVNFMTYLALFQAFLNIVLSYIFIKYLNFGINGVILATCFCMMTNIFFLPNLLKKKLKRIRK